MRPLVVVLLLLAGLAPGAAAACGEPACADTWSAKEGSCGGAGSERNVAKASVAPIDFSFYVRPWGRLGETRASAETFCVTSDEQEYRHVWVNVTADPLWLGPRIVNILWSWDGGTCETEIYRADRAQAERSMLGCPAGRPPALPALLP